MVTNPKSGDLSPTVNSYQHHQVSLHSPPYAHSKPKWTFEAKEKSFHVESSMNVGDKHKFDLVE